MGSARRVAQGLPNHQASCLLLPTGDPSLVLDCNLPLLNQLNESRASLPNGHSRQAAVWRGQEPDFLPLLVESVGQPWGGQVFSLPEQLADPDKMLHEALLSAVKQIPVQSDSVLCLRPQFGVGGLATVFGVEYELSATYGSPWVVRPATKEYLSSLEPDALDFERSLVPRMCRFLERFRAQLDGRLEVYLPDTQGPFDIAHLARGHDLFTDLHDDPPFVHHLMELATEVYVRATRMLKAAAGEPPDAGHHSGCIYMEKCGVRLCDDSGSLLSPRLLVEFVLPYHRRALAAFGGGWVHWCGYRRHMVDAYLPLPEVRGINIGHMGQCDPAEVLPRVAEAGKVYVGNWPRPPGQSLEEYFASLLRCLGGRKRGLILQMGRDETMPPTQEIMLLWQVAQDRAGR